MPSQGHSPLCLAPTPRSPVSWRRDPDQPGHSQSPAPVVRRLTGFSSPSAPCPPPRSVLVLAFPTSSGREFHRLTVRPPSPEVGGGVSLAPQNPPQDFVLCYWYRSATAAVNSRILNYYPQTPTQQNGPAHTGRETAGPGCVLHIAGLTLNDNGSYTVEIQSPTSPGNGTVHLPVYEKLAKPTVTASKTQVPENGTLTLTCNTSPSADTVLWLQNGSYIAPNKRLGLSPDNRTLTVQNFTWGDAGTYQCEVGNPVSTERSEPSTVTLAYGPESARIDPPGPVNLTLGSRLTLTCVADSVPAPSYSWFLNGNKLPQIGSSLTFDLTTLNLGTYKCQADNPVTGLTANAEIEVLASAADSSGGLSPGAIAGIVIGSLAAAALIGGLLYFLLCRTGGETKQHSPVEGQAAPAQNQGVSGSKPTLGEEDIQYSTLAFSAGDQKPPPGPQTPREGGTVYSEIRKK